jgi:hypothetical protein
MTDTMPAEGSEAGEASGAKRAGPDRRVLLIAVGAVLLLVLAFAVVKALSGGSGSVKSAAHPVVAPQLPTGSPTTTTTTTPSPHGVQSFEVFSDKNPFQPL